MLPEKTRRKATLSILDRLRQAGRGGNEKSQSAPSSGPEVVMNNTNEYGEELEPSAEEDSTLNSLDLSTSLSRLLREGPRGKRPPARRQYSR